MKHKLITLIIALAIASCATPSPVPPLPTFHPSATFNQLPTPSLTPERTTTPFLTATPLPSATPIPIQSPTATNTEIAPEDVGVCPAENPDLKPDFTLDTTDETPFRQLFELSLDFLNQGGTTDALFAVFDQVHKSYYHGDLTGDGIPEIGLHGMFRYDVMGCVGKRYVQLLHFDLPGYANVEIRLIKDLNLNSIPDVVFFSPQGCGFNACYETAVYEWQETEFHSLTDDPDYGYNGAISMTGIYDLEVKDINGNGTFELILSGGIPFWDVYYSGIPWRFQSNTYMWDGDTYSLYRTQFSAPEYRFQAIQDGDEAFRWKEYDNALAFYQQVIFDDKLKSWSSEQQAYEQAVWEANLFPETPTPAPTPSPDPAEYPNLAAYARYRIMLLHFQQGHDSDAKVVYDTLQQKFTPGQAGYIYAELAATFWSDYQTNRDLKQACAQAIEFAASHKVAVLTYLGNIEGIYRNAYHGYQSHDYTPEDICPLQ